MIDHLVGNPKVKASDWRSGLWVVSGRCGALVAAEVALVAAEVALVAAEVALVAAEVALVAAE
jgi:hypothetical protein